MPNKFFWHEKWTVEYLRGVFHYEAFTGTLFSRETGRPVGTESSGGYLAVRLDGHMPRVHRLIWAIVSGNLPGEKYIDHINGNRLDNRPENLRLTNHFGNARNTKLSVANESGVPGVLKIGPDLWKVTVGRQVIGTYRDLEEALAVRANAQMLHKYHRNHGRRD